VKFKVSSHLYLYVSEVKVIVTSHGKVLFWQAGGKCIVAQQPSQVTLHLSGSYRTAALKVWPGRQYLVDESSSSGPTKLATFATDICKECLYVDMSLYKIHNPEVRNFLLKLLRQITQVIEL
jgi:hypothetical protein